MLSFPFPSLVSSYDSRETKFLLYGCTVSTGQAMHTISELAFRPNQRMSTAGKSANLCWRGLHFCGRGNGASNIPCLTSR